MANSNPVPRSGTHDLAPRIRGAFIRAMESIETDTGKTFSQMMRECIEKDGLLAVLDRLAKYTVRENKITGNINHKHTVKRLSETDSWLAAIIDTDEDSAPAESVPNGSVLSAEVRDTEKGHGTSLVVCEVPGGTE